MMWNHQLTLGTIVLAGIFSAVSVQAQVVWSGAGDGSTWGDDNNWTGGQEPALGDNVDLAGASVVVDTNDAAYANFENNGGSVTVNAGGILTTNGTFAAVRYIAGMTVNNGGALLNPAGTAWLRSTTVVNSGGLVQGFATLRDNDLTLSGGTFAPRDSVNGNNDFSFGTTAADFYLDTGTLQLDLFGDGVNEYWVVGNTSSDLWLDTGTVELVPQGGYVPASGDSFQIFDNTAASTDILFQADAANVVIQGFKTVTWDTSQWDLTDGTLTVETLVVPEPATLGVFALGLLCLARRRRA